MHLLCTAAFPVHDQDTVAAAATNLLVVYLVSICKACMRPRVPLMIEKKNIHWLSQGIFDLCQVNYTLRRAY